MKELGRLCGERQVNLILICLLLVIVFIVFLPSLENGFVDWDDYRYTLDNNLIKELSLGNTRNIFTSFSNKGSFYRPLVLLSLSLEHHFFKRDPFFYHLVNLFLHLGNCILVFWLIWLMTEESSISFLTALFFGIHPLQVESVAWISEIKGLIYGLFFLAAAINYILYLKLRKSRYYCGSLFLFFCSFLAKPMGAMFPFLLFIFDFLKRRRFTAGILLEKLPFFAVSFALTVFNLSANHLKFFGKEKGMNVLLVGSNSVLFYLKKIIFPIKLSCFYPYPLQGGGFLPTIFIFSPVILLLIISTAIFINRYTKKVTGGLMFFLISILPALRQSGANEFMTADRYVYIPAIGIFYIFSEFFFRSYSRAQKFHVMAGPILIVFLISSIFVFSILSRKRIGVWKDNFSLWDDSLKNYPNIYAYNNRGSIYKSRGRLSMAISDYNKAIEIDSTQANVYFNRANAYLAKGDFELAVLDLDSAIALNLNDGGYYSSRAVAYFFLGDYDLAWRDLYKAQSLGCPVPDDILRKLKLASGRER